MQRLARQPLRAVPLALAGCWRWSRRRAGAGLFDDDEARKAILDLRAQADAGQRASSATQRAAPQLTEQLQSAAPQPARPEQPARGHARRSWPSCAAATSSCARRAELQRKQKDMGQAVDERLRKLEPQKVALDGSEFLADPEEKRQYDEAIALLRAGDFDKAAWPLTAFQRALPGQRLRRLGALLARQCAVRQARLQGGDRRVPRLPGQRARTIRARPRRCWRWPTARPR